jgi:serine/threonine protein kinase
VTDDDTRDPLDIAEVALAVVEGSLSETTSRAQAERPGLVRELEDLRAILQAFEPVADPEQATRPSPTPSWGPYTLKEEVGRGGFGVVCRGFDPAVDREIAVKLYRGRELPSEPRLMARVRHANVVTVYGAAVYDGKPGIWMEFVHGRTLADRVEAEGPLAPDAALRIGRELCGALDAVHRAGLIHQDIKPRNVMEETGGRIVLMDFGAGVSLDENPEGRIVGTPLYMAPEVVLGGAPSEQSDIYGLGVLLFYLLTGTYPVYATSLDELRRVHERQPDRKEKSIAVVLRELRPGVSRALARAVAQALAPAHRRFRTPTELDEALRRAQHPLWPRVAAVGSAALAVAATLWLLVPRPSVVRPQPQSANPTPTTVVTPTPTEEPPPPRATAAVAAAIAGARAIITATAPPRPSETPSWPGVTLMIVTRTAPPHTPTATSTAEPSPTVAPPMEMATLILKVKPSAEVTVDGTPQGRGERLSLSAGAHRLVFNHPDYQPLKRAVTLQPGETKTLTVDLRDEAVKLKR